MDSRKWEQYGALIVVSCWIAILLGGKHWPDALWGVASAWIVYAVVYAVYYFYRKHVENRMYIIPRSRIYRS